LKQHQQKKNKNPIKQQIYDMLSHKFSGAVGKEGAKPVIFKATCSNKKPKTLKPSYLSETIFPPGIFVNQQPDLAKAENINF
jgi:hypothetical protein